MLNARLQLFRVDLKCNNISKLSLFHLHLQPDFRNISQLNCNPKIKTMFKKFLVILSLLLLLNHSIDYQADEFDGVREQWSYVQSNPYYVQIEAYVSPIYSSIYKNEHLSSAVQNIKTRTDSIYVDHIKEYVDVANDNVINSPVYQTVKPYIYEYYGVLNQHLRALNNYITYYAAYSSYEVVKFFNHYVLGMFDYDYSAKLECWKRCSLKFYNHQLLPIVNVIGGHTVRYAIIAAEHVELIVRYSFAQINTFLHHYVCPFFQSFIAPHLNHFYQSQVEPHYIKYVNPYIQSHFKPFYFRFVEPSVNCVIGQVSKYYNLLKLEQALGLSKELISNSYKNALSYFQEKEIDKSHQLQIIDLDGDNDLEIIEGSNDSKHLSLAQNLEGWKEYMDQRIYSFFSDFENEVEELEEAKISQYQPEITQLLQKLSVDLHHDYNEINKVISIINSHQAFLENGEEVELDSAGNVIDHQITRQEVRDLLKEGQDKGGAGSERVNNKLRELVSLIEIEIDDIRHTQVDTFEDFYVIAIKEYSENIMASDYADSFQKYNKEDAGDDMSEWRAYAKIKKNLIKKRDELTQFKPALLKLEKLLGEIKYTLKTFQHEQGSYYSLLRAKANIEFQTREKREREELELIERGESAENEEEIVGTLTQTFLKVLTVGQDAEAEPTVEVTAAPSVDIKKKDFDESVKEEEPLADEEVEPAATTAISTPELTSAEKTEEVTAAETSTESIPVIELEETSTSEETQPILESTVEESTKESIESSTEKEQEQEQEQEKSSSSNKPIKKTRSKLSRKSTTPKNQTVAVADQGVYKTVELV